MKRCPSCGITKELNEFANNRSAYDGKQTYCRPCGSRATMASRARTGRRPLPRTAEQKARERDRSLVKKYGMTRSEIDVIAIEQGGCLLCRTLNPTGKGWHVDHDHACCPGPYSCLECVRGVLCSECNTGLGKFRDNPTVLRRAADYVLAARTTRKVLTVGTFDLPHAGHVELFEQCRKLAGDRGRVVVGVNTSEFVRRFKNVDPIMSLDERLAAIQAIKYVDEVVVNTVGADLKPMLQEVAPAYLAVGDDWAKKDYFGQINASAEWLSERDISVVYLPRTTGVSSTLIKGRMDSTVIDRATSVA